MRTTLEDLYYGNITPCEQQMIPGSELKRSFLSERIEFHQFFF